MEFAKRISFTVFGEPKALKRHRTFRRGNFTGQYDPSKADKHDFLVMAARYRPDEPINEPIMLVVRAYFAYKKIHYRTGRYADQLRDDAPMVHTVKPDASNVLKFIEDSLNGIFWRDDSLICGITFFKYYDKTPRIEIDISTIK